MQPLSTTPSVQVAVVSSSSAEGQISPGLTLHSKTRSGRHPKKYVQATSVVVGDIELNEAEHTVTVRGESVAIPLKEFDVLRLLMTNVGQVMTRELLIDRVWGPDYYGDTKTLDVHVKRVRAKIESDPTNPTRIITVRGLGYKFERPAT